MSKQLPICFLLIISILFYCCPHVNAQEQSRAKKIMDSLILILPTQKEDTNKAINLMWLSRLKMGQAQNTGNWSEAIEWWQKTLSLSKKTNYDWGMGKSYIYLGQCWTHKGDVAEAMKYFYAALNLSLKNGNKNLTAAAYGNLAGCISKLGDDKEALKNLLLVYKIIQREGDNVSANSQQGAAAIAGLYAKMKNWTEALSWYQKALPDDTELFYEGDITLQIASIQMGMKRYDDALKNYRIAIQLIPKRFDRKPDSDYKGLVGGWYQQLGEVYFQIGTLTKDTERTASFNEAVNYLNKSLPLLSEGAGGKESLMKTYELLKQACEETGDYQNALHFTTLYNVIKDSIYNVTTYQKTADLRIRYETEKAATEMNVKREKEKMKERALRDSMLAAQNLQHEKEFHAEKLKEAKSSAEQKINYEKSIAAEKSKQDKINAEKQRVNNLLLMGLILVIITSGFLVLYFRQRQLKKRAIEKAATVHKMAELEMQSLRSQLNPHFMFNSLNSLQRLILMEENDKSQSYLARFSKMLRMLLENADKPFVTLQKEIDFLQLYLGLEKLRIPDLQYSVSTDPSLDTEKTFMPNMILQPYVENAIWHGLSHKEDDKQLQIRIYRENGTVNCEIEDNGVGRKKAEELKSLFRKQHQSKGMELLTKRFRLLNEEYGSDIQAEIIDLKKNEEDSGVLVTVKVPVMLSQQTQN
jgi:tetratricopeptide (TPR) repeat protein